MCPPKIIYDVVYPRNNNIICAAANKFTYSAYIVTFYQSIRVVINGRSGAQAGLKQSDGVSVVPKPRRNFFDECGFMGGFTNFASQMPHSNWCTSSRQHRHGP